jgi:hypothetical protein
VKHRKLLLQQQEVPTPCKFKPKLMSHPCRSEKPSRVRLPIKRPLYCPKPFNVQCSIIVHDNSNAHRVGPLQPDQCMSKYTICLQRMIKTCSISFTRNFGHHLHYLGGMPWNASAACVFAQSTMVHREASDGRRGCMQSILNPSVSQRSFVPTIGLHSHADCCGSV